MQNNDDDDDLLDLELDEGHRKLSEEAQEESEKAKQNEDLEGDKARGKHNRSERVKDHLACAMIVAIWFFLGFAIVVAGSVVTHYTFYPHLSDVGAEVLKGALASFTILNAVLIATKTIDLG